MLNEPKDNVRSTHAANQLRTLVGVTLTSPIYSLKTTNIYY